MLTLDECRSCNPSRLFKMKILLLFHLCLGLPNSLFPSPFLIKFLYAILPPLPPWCHLTLSISSSLTWPPNSDIVYYGSSKRYMPHKCRRKWLVVRHQTPGTVRQYKNISSFTTRFNIGLHIGCVLCLAQCDTLFLVSYAPGHGSWWIYHSTEVEKPVLLIRLSVEHW